MVWRNLHPDLDPGQTVVAEKHKGFLTWGMQVRWREGQTGNVMETTWTGQITVKEADGTPRNRNGMDTEQTGHMIEKLLGGSCWKIHQTGADIDLTGLQMKEMETGQTGHHMETNMTNQGRGAEI